MNDSMERTFKNTSTSPVHILRQETVSSLCNVDGCIYNLFKSLMDLKFQRRYVATTSMYSHLNNNVEDLTLSALKATPHFSLTRSDSGSMPLRALSIGR